MTVPDFMLDPRRHCRGSTLMFPKNKQGLAVAVAVCKPPGRPACPCLEECLEWAIVNYATSLGVCGGQSMTARKRTAKKRGLIPDKTGPKPASNPVSACRRALSYATEDEAWQASPQHWPYRCDLCGMWHHTTKRRAA